MAPRSLLALSILLACTTQAAPPAGHGDKQAPKFDAAPASETAKPVVAAPAPAPTPAGIASSCDGARFALAPDAVVATLDGVDITARELGDEARKAEEAALRTYCDSVSRVRDAALESTVQRKLLDKAGAAEGVDGETWLRTKVASMVEKPSDEDITAFYEKYKSENAPPLDQVREQVMAEILKDRNGTAASTVLADLRRPVKLETKLPDVRPAPIDLRDADTTATFGPADAAVHIVEFSDFECPYCVRAAASVRELKEKYGDKVRFSYRHFPLTFHPNAREAAEGAQCAQAQDKFWAFHDAVFATTDGLGGGGVRKAAETAGLDMNAYDACLASGKAAAQIDADMAKASEVGVGGTPSFFVNGRAFEGGASDLAGEIDVLLARAGK